MSKTKFLPSFFHLHQGEYIGTTVAGLALVYALLFTQYLPYIIRFHAETQNNMISVERVQEYCGIDQEKYQPDDVCEGEYTPIAASTITVFSIAFKSSFKQNRESENNKNNQNYNTSTSTISTASTLISTPTTNTTNTTNITTGLPLYIHPRRNNRPIVPDNWQ